MILTMKFCTTGVVFLLAVFKSVYTDEFVPQNMVVETQNGAVAATKIYGATGKLVNAFYGIPYAQPPVGDLRFKPAEPAKSWPELLNAHTIPKACMQVVKEKKKMEGHNWWFADEDSQSEDCLYLNVLVPGSRPKNASVMVFIHGGGFEAGSGTLEKYNGSILAAEGNVIFVSINYRLSVFGFLYLDSPEGECNLGLKDQTLALKWIKNNIAYFGGDPSKITIFGHSAGASSVGYHLLLPTSQDLFQRAILQSGAASSPWAYTKKHKAVKAGFQFAEVLGCSNPTNDTKLILDCLRKKEAKELVTAVLQTPKSSLFRFPPVVDGVFIPDFCLDGKILHNNKKDILVGDTKDEGSFMILMSRVLNMTEDSFLTDEQFYTHIKKLISFFVEENEVLAKLVKFSYTNWKDPTNLASIREQAVRFLSDSMFTCSLNYLADYADEIGSNVYRYVFSHIPSIQTLPKWAGSAHGDELDFVFGSVLNESKSYTYEEKKLSKSTVAVVTHFAKTGNPNYAGEKTGKLFWPKYNTKDRNYLDVGLNVQLKSGGPRVKHCAFWNKLVPDLYKTWTEEKTQCESANARASKQA